MSTTNNRLKRDALIICGLTGWEMPTEDLEKFVSFYDELLSIYESGAANLLPGCESAIEDLDAKITIRERNRLICDAHTIAAITGVKISYNDIEDLQDFVDRHRYLLDGVVRREENPTPVEDVRITVGEHELKGYGYEHVVHDHDGREAVYIGDPDQILPGTDEPPWDGPLCIEDVLGPMPEIPTMDGPILSEMLERIMESLRQEYREYHDLLDKFEAPVEGPRYQYRVEPAPPEINDDDLKEIIESLSRTVDEYWDFANQLEEPTNSTEEKNEMNREEEEFYDHLRETFGDDVAEAHMASRRRNQRRLGQGNPCKEIPLCVRDLEFDGDVAAMLDRAFGYGVNFSPTEGYLIGVGMPDAPLLRLIFTPGLVIHHPGSEFVAIIEGKKTSERFFGVGLEATIGTVQRYLRTVLARTFPGDE